MRSSDSRGVSPIQAWSAPARPAEPPSSAAAHSALRWESVVDGKEPGRKEKHTNRGWGWGDLPGSASE